MDPSHVVKPLNSEVIDTRDAEEDFIALEKRWDYHVLRFNTQHATQTLGFFSLHAQEHGLVDAKQKVLDSMHQAMVKHEQKLAEYRSEFFAKQAAARARKAERKRSREEHAPADDTINKRVRKQIEKAVKEKAEAAFKVAFEAAMKEAREQHGDMSQAAVTARAIQVYNDKLLGSLPEIEGVD